MTIRTALASLAVLIFVAAPSLAQCKESGKKCDKPCTKKCDQPCTKKCDEKAKQECKSQCKTPCTKGKAACDTKSSCKSSGCGDTNCSGELVRYKGSAIPRMVYMVKGETFTCPRTAVTKAKDEGVDIQYVVGEKTYTDRNEALTAHSVELEQYLETTLTVRCAGATKAGCCPVKKADDKQAGFCLGSYKFGCKESAEKAALQAREAANKIELVMKVGDECYKCPTQAAGAAKKCNGKVTYCVGKAETTSETIGKLQLTVQRIKAALDTYEKLGGKPIEDA